MASLGKDLAAIRKKQNLSLDDIHEATKIPKHIITSIENDTIFTEYDENLTYIRSYVRSYAKALSIDDQQIVYALDKQEFGSYSGSLLSMGENKADEPFDFEKEEEESKEKPVDEKSEKDEKTKEETTESEPTPPLAEPAPSPQPQDYSKNVDWVDMGRQFQPLPQKSKIWVGVLVILLLGAGGLYFFLGNSSSSPDENTSESQATTTIPDDSLQLNIVPPTESDSAILSNIAQNNQQDVREALSDTLAIVVYAAYGKLEPVRVFTDLMGSINPYWIEEGQAMRFPFVNDFRLRGQFSNIELLMNGHVIENPLEKFYDAGTRQIEINRSFFEGNEKWLQPAPDSLNIDAPPPSVILDRPTYN